MPATADEKRKRAQSVEELTALLPKMVASEGQLATAVPYRARPTDVIITPFAKCGTTMLQQMFHQLRMAKHGGDMDFDDISRVVPWIETAAVLDLDINAEQRANPRGFKSHLHYEGLPASSRYVVTLRDPQEAYISFYHFFSGWLFEPGTIAQEELVPIWLREEPDRPNYYTHLLSWWARRNAPDTLLMDYRDVLSNKRETICKMAEFAGMEIGEAVIDMVEERTSRAFMMAHKAPFGDPMMRKMSEAKARLPEGSDSAKIRSQSASREPLPQSITKQLDAIWAEQVAPITGHGDYASLAAALNHD